MNIFLRELRANLKSLLIWSVILGALIAVGVAKFSAFAGNPEMLQILDSMPVAMLDAMNLRAFNLTTLSGFFGIMFVYFGLMGAMAAALWHVHYRAHLSCHRLVIRLRHAAIQALRRIGDLDHTDNLRRIHPLWVTAKP
jgi:hypothetical protein